MTRPAATTGDVLAEAINAFDAGDMYRAYQLCQETLAAVRHGAAGGARDGDAATWYLARVFLDGGQTNRAQTLLMQFIADVEADTTDPYDIYAALARVTLGDVLRRTGNPTDATAQYRQVLRRRPDDPDHPTRWAVLLAQAGLARVDADNGLHREARDALTQVAAAIGRRFGLYSADALLVLRDLADLHTALDDHDAARDTLDVAVTTAAEQYGAGHGITVGLGERLAALTETAAEPKPDPARRLPGRPAEAIRLDRPHRRWPIWQGLLLLLALAVVAASAATFVAFHAAAPSEPQPPSTPGGSPLVRGTPSLASSSSSTAAGLAAPQPPGHVRVTPVPGTDSSLDVTWDDPSGGTRASIVSLAREGEPLRVRATVQAATSHYRVTGLTWGVRYCVGVATAYSAALVVAADAVCVRTSERGGTASPRGGRLRRAHRASSITAHNRSSTLDRAGATGPWKATMTSTSPPDPADEPAHGVEQPPPSNDTGARAGFNAPMSDAAAIRLTWRAGGAAALLITAFAWIATVAGPAPAGQSPTPTPTAAPSKTGPAWHTVPGLDTFQRLSLFADQLIDADSDATAGPYTCRRIQQWARATADVHRTDTTYCRNDTDGSGLEFGRTLPDRRGLLPLPDGSDRDQFAAAPLFVQHYAASELRLDVPEPVPTNPAGLTDAALQHRPNEDGPAFLVNRVADLLTQQYLDRAHRAAALLVLAGAQGLTFAGPVNDLAGRPGMAFTLTAPDSILTCIFNPTTGQLLAFTEVVPDDRKTKTVRPGLLDYSLLLGMRHQALLPEPSAPPGTIPGAPTPGGQLTPTASTNATATATTRAPIIPPRWPIPTTTGRPDTRADLGRRVVVAVSAERFPATAVVAIGDACLLKAAHRPRSLRSVGREFLR